MDKKKAPQKRKLNNRLKITASGHNKVRLFDSFLNECSKKKMFVSPSLDQIWMLGRLESLHLTDNTINRFNRDNVAKGLEFCKRLKTLDISRNILPLGDISCILESIGKLSRLEVLDIRWVLFSEHKHMDVLASSLRNLRCLKNLYLKRNCQNSALFSSDVTLKIIKVLHPDPLRVLDIDDWFINDTHAFEFSTLVENFKNLQYISFTTYVSFVRSARSIVFSISRLANLQEFKWDTIDLGLCVSIAEDIIPVVFRNHYNLVKICMSNTLTPNIFSFDGVIVKFKENRLLMAKRIYVLLNSPFFHLNTGFKHRVLDRMPDNFLKKA